MPWMHAGPRYLDPESEAGISLRKLIPGALRLLTEAECVRLRAGADPARIMRAGGADWTREAVEILGGLSEGRLMHAFTESIGIPLRPYLQWLKIQRAAAAIVGGATLSSAAAEAGFADAAHMSRTFRKTFGVTPSTLRPSKS